MHRSQIFRTLVSVLFVGIISMLPTAFVQAAKVDVFADFQKKLSQLEGDLKKEKDTVKRYDVFLKAYRDLSDLRAKNPRQSEENELHMSMFMDSLSYLPEKKNFKAKKCNDYKKEVKSMMTSYQKDQKEPFVEKAFGIVDLICR